MPNKMERFTQRGRRVLSLAQEAAEKLQHNYIGTEHLLLGLMREEGGIASRVLSGLGLKLEETRAFVSELAGTEEKASGIDLSTGTKRVLELAVEEARKMGHHYIGTEHLLLGLNRQRDKHYLEILNKFGITPDEVLHQTRRVLQEAPDPVSTTSSSTVKSSSIMPASFTRMRLQGRVLSKLIARLAQTMDEASKIELQTQIEALFQEALLEVGVELSNIERTRLLNQILAPLKKPHDPEVSIRVTDAKTSELKFEVKTTLAKLQEGLQTLMDVADGDATSKIELVDENVRIEITFTESSDL